MSKRTRTVNLFIGSVWWAPLKVYVSVRPVDKWAIKGAIVAEATEAMRRIPIVKDRDCRLSVASCVEVINCPLLYAVKANPACES